MAAAATADYDGDRDLKTKEETKRKDAMVDFAGGFLAASNKPTAEAHWTKRKEATSTSSEAISASEHDAAAIKKKKKKKEEEGDSLFKEGEMLRLREEYWAAEGLWRDKLVPGALDRWLKRKSTTQQVPAVAGTKRRKVVRVILPDSHIDHIKENPGMMRELSDEEMAECPERFRRTYAITKLINAKNRAYQQALFDQHRAFGFAYDEKEVTDDDEKEVAVVKN